MRKGKHLSANDLINFVVVAMGVASGVLMTIGAARSLLNDESGEYFTATHVCFAGVLGVALALGMLSKAIQMCQPNKSSRKP